MDLRIGGVIVALGLALGACGEPAAELDGGARVDASALLDAGVADAAHDAQLPLDAAGDDGGADGGSSDSGLDAGGDSGHAGDAGQDGGTDAGAPDAGRGVLDVRVRADAACSDLSFDPPSISVPAGTSFTVNWINATGCTEIDIDMGGTVPIVLGLEPGTSYHDTIRQWCGTYTGTYVFRAYYAPSFPYYLDVDCSG